MSKGGSGGAKSGSGPSKGSGSGSKTATPERKAGSSKAPASARAAPGGKKTLGGKGSEQLDEAGIEFLKNLKGVDWGEQHDEVEPSQAEVEEGIKKQLEQEEGTKPDVDLSLDLVIKTNVADDQHLIQAPPGVREDFFRSLTHLHLDRCRIASLSFEVLSQLPSATHLYLQHNRIERVGNLGVMRGLQFLALSHNNIAQHKRIQRVCDLGVMRGLQFLALSHNNIAQHKRIQLVCDLGVMRGLQFLALSHNNIAQHKRIQRVCDLGVMRGLQFLALSHNNIAQHKRIQRECDLGVMRGLQFLALSHNNIAQHKRIQLVCDLGVMRGLQFLALSHNNIAQHKRIQRVCDLGVMRGLQFLALSHNNIAQLEGLFPLTHLMFLDLSHNKLSHPQRSQLPESIRILKVDGNPFLLVPDGGSAVLDEIIEGLPNLRDLDVEEFEEDPRKDLEPSSGQPGVSRADAVATLMEGAQELFWGMERRCSGVIGGGGEVGHASFLETSGDEAEDVM
eukprot:gene15284-21367_t